MAKGIGSMLLRGDMIPAAQQSTQYGGPRALRADAGVPGNPQQLPIAPQGRRQQRWARWTQENSLLAVFDPHHYAWLRGELVFNLNTGASVKVLDQPTTFRNLLQFRNASPGTEVIYISFGGPASVNSIIALAAKGANTRGDQMNYTDVDPQDEVYAYSPSTTAVLVLAYSTIAAATPTV